MVVSLKLIKKSLVIAPVAASLLASGILSATPTTPESPTAGIPAARRPPGRFPVEKAPPIRSGGRGRP